MSKSVRELLEADEAKEYCTAETRQQQTGSSWASTTLSCTNRATKTYVGDGVMGRGPQRVCGIHYNFGPSQEEKTDACVEQG